MNKVQIDYQLLAKQRLALYLERKGLKNTRWQCVLFDMDGVLLDSMPAHVRSWLQTAEAYNLLMTETDVYMFEGQTGRQTINVLINRTYSRLATDLEVKDIYAYKSKLFLQYNTGKLIEGATDLVKNMEHLDRVLVTGSSQRSLIDLVSKSYPNVFSEDRQITGLDVKKGKPDPEPYLKGMDRVGVRSEECIVVENAPCGVYSARKSGAFVLAVNTGPLDDDILYQYGADIVCPNMSTASVVAEVLLQTN